MSDQNGGVIVKLHGALRYEVGGSSISVPGDVGTVAGALRNVASSHGARAHEMMFDHAGELWRSLILLLNDEPTPLGADTPVQAGDVVTVLMPLAGG